MFSPKEASTVLGLLNEADDRPLEALIAAWQRAINRTDFFRLGLSLSLLLTDPTASSLRSVSRIAALGLLFELGKTDERGLAIFAPALAEVARRSDAPEERAVALVLLTGPPRDFFKRSPADLLRHPPPLPSPLPDVGTIRKAYGDKVASFWSVLRRNGIAAALVDTAEDADAATDDGAVLTEELPLPPALARQLDVPFPRTAPPMLEMRDDEFLWLEPGDAGAIRGLLDTFAGPFSLISLGDCGIRLFDTHGGPPFRLR
jgi:hypothetical protein